MQYGSAGRGILKRCGQREGFYSIPAKPDRARVPDGYFVREIAVPTNKIFLNAYNTCGFSHTIW